MISRYAVEHRTTHEIAELTFNLAVDNKLPTFLNGEYDIYMTESSGVQSFNFQTDDEVIPVRCGATSS